MQSILEHILAKPAMYCGKRFETIDEFSLFFYGVRLGLGTDDRIPSKDRLVITEFGTFMRHHLHGENKNCRWEYDLLSRSGSHSAAIQSATVLMLYIRRQLDAEGVENLDDLFRRASRIYAYLKPDGQYAVSDQSQSEENPQLGRSSDATTV